MSTGTVSVGVEHRSVILPQGELRTVHRTAADGADPPDGPPTIVGHAAVFSRWTVLYEGNYLVMREIIRPGAFARAIREQQDVRSLFNHDANFILGRIGSGTLKLSEDDRGLLTETDPPDTQAIRDLVLVPIERQDIPGMSFAFVPRRDKEEKIVQTPDRIVIDRGGERLTIRLDGQRQIEERELLDVDLFDIGPVTNPAYLQTDVALRSLAQQREKELQGRRARRQHLDRAGMRLRLLGAALESTRK